MNGLSNQYPPTVVGMAAANANPLQAYQAQLQANQAALSQQLPPQQRPNIPPSQPQASSMSIAQQQQQHLMSRAMEKQNETHLDKSRVTLLLEINAELLKEVLNVQPKFKTPEEAKNDPVFRECMRRLQQNLAYLAAIADRSHKPAALIPTCPGVLLPPPDMPVLDTLYKKLHELYPGINPANPPQIQQNAQLAAPGRPGQNVSPKQPMPPQQSNMHTSPSPHQNHDMTSPPPQMNHHQSPPPGMHIQQQPPPPPPPPPPVVQQPQQQPPPQQIMYHPQQMQHQGIPPHYAQQMQQRQQVMLRAQQQQQVQQQQQQHQHMMVGPGMVPQQAYTMPPQYGMGGMVTANNLMVGGMGGGMASGMVMMPPGYQDPQQQQMWNPGWQGGGG